MPTVLLIDRLRVVIYPNDHPPAHVHVIGPGWVVVVNLIGLHLREVIGCDERQARRVLRLVGERRGTLLEAWKRIHG